MELQNTSIIGELSSSDPMRQLNGLQSILAMAAQGRDVSDFLTVVIQRTLADKANRTVRKFGYQIIRQCTSSLVKDTWTSVEKAINTDLAPDKENIEVALYALRTLCSLPRDKLQIYVSKNVKVVESTLKHTNYRMRETATLVLAALMSPPKLLGGNLKDLNVHTSKVLNTYGTLLCQQLLDPADNVAAVAFNVVKELCSPNAPLYCHQELQFPPLVPVSVVQYFSGELLYKMSCRTTSMTPSLRLDALRVLTLLSLQPNKDKLASTPQTIVQEIALPLVLSAAHSIGLLIEACHSILLVTLTHPGSCRTAVTAVVQFYLDSLSKGGEHITEQTVLHYAREIAIGLPTVPPTQQLSNCLRFLYTSKSLGPILSHAALQELEIISCLSSFGVLFHSENVDVLLAFLKHPYFTGYLWAEGNNGIRERVVCMMCEVLLDITHLNTLVLMTNKVAECLLWKPETTKMFYSNAMRLICHTATVATSKDQSVLSTFLHDLSTMYIDVSYVSVVIAQFAALNDSTLCDALAGSSGEGRYLMESRQRGNVVPKHSASTPLYYTFLTPTDYPWLQAVLCSKILLVDCNSKGNIITDRRVHSVMITGSSDPLRILATYVTVPGNPLMEVNLVVTNATPVNIPRAVVTFGCIGEVRPFSQMNASVFVPPNTDSSRMTSTNNADVQALGVGKFLITKLDQELSVNISTTFILDRLHADNAITVTLDVAVSESAAADGDDDFNFEDDNAKAIEYEQIITRPIVMNLVHYFNPRQHAKNSTWKASLPMFASVLKALPASVSGKVSLKSCQQIDVPFKSIVTAMDLPTFECVFTSENPSSFELEYVGQLTPLDSKPTDYFIFIFHASRTTTDVIINWDVRSRHNTVTKVICSHPDFDAFIHRVCGLHDWKKVSQQPSEIAVLSEDQLLQQWKSLHQSREHILQQQQQQHQKKSVPIPSVVPSQSTSNKPPAVLKPTTNDLDNLFS